MGPHGGAEFRFISPQPDTSQRCETMDTGLVHRVVCPFTPQQSPVLVNRPPDGWQAELALVHSSHGWDSNLRPPNCKSSTLQHGSEPTTLETVGYEQHYALFVVETRNDYDNDEYGCSYVLMPKLRKYPGNSIYWRKSHASGDSLSAGGCLSLW